METLKSLSEVWIVTVHCSSLFTFPMHSLDIVCKLFKKINSIIITLNKNVIKELFPATS